VLAQIPLYLHTSRDSLMNYQPGKERYHNHNQMWLRITLIPVVSSSASLNPSHRQS
jgi:hypothetical protein